MASRTPAPLFRSSWREKVEELGRDAELEAALPMHGEPVEEWLARRRAMAQRFTSLMWPAAADPAFVAASCQRTLEEGRPTLASPGKGATPARVDAALAALLQMVLGDIVVAEEEGGGVVIFEREPELQPAVEEGPVAPAPAAEPWEEPAPAAVEPLPQPEPTPSDRLVAELIPAEPAPPEPAPLPPGDWQPIAAAAAELGADPAALEALVARGALIAHVDGALILVQAEQALEALTAPDPVADDDDPGEALDELLDELRERTTRFYREKQIPMVCGRCGKQFLAKSRRGKWCSGACRSAASKERLIEARGYFRKPKG